MTWRWLELLRPRGLPSPPTQLVMPQPQFPDDHWIDDEQQRRANAPDTSHRAPLLVPERPRHDVPRDYNAEIETERADGTFRYFETRPGPCTFRDPPGQVWRVTMRRAGA